MYFKGFGASGVMKAIGVVDMIKAMNAINALIKMRNRLKSSALGCLAGMLGVCALGLAPLYAAAGSKTPESTAQALESKTPDPSTPEPLGSNANPALHSNLNSGLDSSLDSALDSSSTAQSEQERKKQLYFLRAQYYEHLRTLAQSSENLHRSGAFLGVVLGSSELDITIHRNGRKYPVSVNPFALGLAGGYTRYVGVAPIGVRVYGQYIAAFGASNNIGDSVQTHLASVNIDFVGDLAITDDGYYLGAYAGVGGGVEAFVQQPQGTPESSTRIVVGSVLNFGLSATLAYDHRLEAGVKVPPSAFGEDFTLGLMYLVGYAYLF